ncbi:MAG: hypothetical protein HY761_08680 [Candidatus Omnitrophica bacterium]|nr:hypothetical protein [Candidatus Omnitrophota bacterium]
MKKFLLGFIVGMFFTGSLYFFLQPDATVRIKMGRLLDRDTLYLKNGDVILGWIVQEEGDKILVEVEKGTFILNRSECKSIQKNTFLRYLRELI